MSSNGLEGRPLAAPSPVAACQGDLREINHAQAGKCFTQRELPYPHPAEHGIVTVRRRIAKLAVKGDALEAQ